MEKKEKSSPGGGPGKATGDSSPGLGADWESAFQMGDYPLPDDEKTVSDFFLGKEEKDTAPREEKGDSQATGKTTRPKKKEDVPDGVRDSVGGFPGKIGTTVLYLPLKLFPSFPRKQLLALPRVLCVGIAWAPFLILFSVALYYATLRPAEAPQAPMEAPADPIALSAESTIHAEDDGERILEREETEPTVSLPETADGLAQEDLKGKKKIRWGIAPFLVAVESAGGDGEPVFVEVEMTLMTLMDEESLPSPEQTAFIRNVVYQFLVNQTLEDLRRYTLSRGTMKSNLFAWLRKMWPESPIYNISIDRYQIL